MNELQRSLQQLDACQEAIEWAKDCYNPQTAWNECPRGDWMLWLVGKVEDKYIHPIRLCVCEIVQTYAIPVWEKYYPNDKRPLESVRIALLFAEGKATLQELSKAEAEAWSAARNWSAAEAARAVAWTAWSAKAKGAETVAVAAVRETMKSVARSESERAKYLRDIADIVRKHFLHPPIIEG